MQKFNLFVCVFLVLVISTIGDYLLFGSVDLKGYLVINMWEMGLVLLGFCLGYLLKEDF